MEEIKYENTLESKNQPKVLFEYSIKDESDRVGYTLSKYRWYKDNGYEPKYPKTIQDKFDRDEMVTDADISEAVSAEFDPSFYVEQIAKIEGDWNKIKDTFFENLKTLGQPIQSDYIVNVTKYGTGGSYGTPNFVQLNLDRKNPTYTLAHEIVHLTIEHLIKRYDIDHWTKERLIDLIMNRFFPDNQRIQRDPENSEQVTQIFEESFPDIEKIILEISQLNK